MRVWCERGYIKQCWTICFFIQQHLQPFGFHLMMSKTLLWQFFWNILKAASFKADNFRLTSLSEYFLKKQGNFKMVYSCSQGHRSRLSNTISFKRSYQYKEVYTVHRIPLRVSWYWGKCWNVEKWTDKQIDLIKT